MAANNKYGKQDKNTVKSEFAIVAAIICFVLGFFVSRLTSGIGGQGRSSQLPIQQPAQSQSFSEEAAWINELKRQAEAAPENADAWTRLGNAYFDTNQQEEAISAYGKSLNLIPNDANVLTDMGIMYRRIGKAREAIGYFNKAAAVDPNHEMSRFNRGIVYLHDLEDTESAVKAWQEVLEINPQFRTPTGQLISDVIAEFQK